MPRPRNPDGTSPCKRCGHTFWSHWQRAEDGGIEPGKCRAKPKRKELRGEDGRCRCEGFV